MGFLKVFSWVSLTGLLLACPVFGQVGKPQTLTGKDYGLWSTMLLQRVSDNGKFVSYSLNYPSGSDTLFVMDANGKRLLSLAKGYKGEFAGDRFASLQPNGAMSLNDLNGGAAQKIAAVDDFEVLHNGTLLLTKDGSKVIEVIAGNGKVLQHIENVSGYALNPQRDKIAVIAGESAQQVLLVSADAKKPGVLGVPAAEYAHLYWDAAGQKLAFTSRQGGVVTALFLYSAPSRVLKSKTLTAAQRDFSVLDIAISPDGKRIGLETIVPDKGQAQKPIPEVWNTKDRVLFSSLNRFPKISAWLWNVDFDRFAEITDSSRTHAIASSDLRFAITENPLENMPSFKPEPDRDLFVKNLETGETGVLLSKFSGQAERLAIAPNGSGVCYLEGNDWFFYDFKTRQSQSLTRGLGVMFADEDNDRPELNRPYALPIWSADGKTVYLYDKFDIWAISKRSKRRMTDGRERSLCFRFAGLPFYDPDGLVSKGVTVNDKSLVLLSAVTDDNSASGIYSFSPKGLVKLSLTDMKTSYPLISKNARQLFWIQEDFNLPPQIAHMDLDAETKNTVFASNPQHKKYAWGRSQLISCRNASGRLMHATLFYPANFDPGKTYPMVVHIYERQRQSLHTYKNPGLNEGAGFNRTNFTLQGYFVLYPDIWHRIGNPGASAVDCTESAVREALRIAPIDGARIGLIGHSMGGYLTNFIVTHSKVFKAAVAGASVSDVFSAYLSMGSNTGIMDASRFEYEQMRIGKPLFEDREAYRRNSPIENATEMNCALLLWTGGNDTQVKPWQSMEFHMALRRLGKESELLVYPQEDHSLSLTKNRMDLTLRVENWFRKYLTP